MPFSHPADFTPVCTTELGTAARLKSEFEKRNVKMAGFSDDPIESHTDWVNDINETQNTTVNFPIIAESDRAVAEAYDMIHPNSDDKTPVCSVFVIDPKKTLRLTLTYPSSAGRNFDEILRVIDSLQLTTYQKVATPADDVVILPTVSDDKAKEFFPAGFTTHRSYLRAPAQPKAD